MTTELVGFNVWLLLFLVLLVVIQICTGALLLFHTIWLLLNTPCICAEEQEKGEWTFSSGDWPGEVDYVEGEVIDEKGEDQTT